MSVFRTILPPGKSDWKISHDLKFFTIGSCFADSIGQYLEVNKFKVAVNPFGTVYNPISIHRHLVNSIHRTEPPENSYLRNGDVFLNYDYHSAFHTIVPRKLEEDIRQALDAAHNDLTKSNVLIITYGTSFVYELISTGEIVANCHKMPSTHFKKRLLTVQEITDDFATLVGDLKKIPSIEKIILTVSPVRHLKDTLELNSVSKAILRTACHTITHQHANVIYFPAFEIMMDDLRDYRFYADDMIHPVPSALDYIWENFSQQYCSLSTIQLLKKWKDVRQAIDHRPLHETDPAYTAFLNSTLTRLKELETLLDVTREIDHLRSRLGLMEKVR